MKVSVFGLGYVGTVSCGCLARDGMDVIGVDVNADKVALLNSGRAPIVEERISDLIADGVAAGRLRATTDAIDAVVNSDVSLVSVGTPSNGNGSLNLSAVQRVSEQIGRAIAIKDQRHLVVVRSTVLPGTVRCVVTPIITRESGKVRGEGFGICFNPEFLREGSSVEDYYNPPYTLIGRADDEDGRTAADLYAGIRADTYYTTIETAEMVKYASNAFHALKISFANEMGTIGQRLGVDSREVMDLVCRDTKLNISSRYMTPGFAFGGSCLPKDLRALLHKAREHDVETPVTRAILESNRAQIDRAIAMILDTRKRKVAMLGLAFKAGTDDLRESPLVIVTEALIGKGLDVRIYDRAISLARLTGANKTYIESEIPHISSLLVDDIEAAIAHGEVIVIGNRSPEVAAIADSCSPSQIVLDLAGLSIAKGTNAFEYHGISW